MADITRLEQFLNHIAHPEDPIPDPLTRMEQSLLEIAENKDEAALPDYSEASDGDVLSIEDGAPAWKAASGGGGDMFVVTLSQDDATTEWTVDKTFAEIMAAHESGKVVLARQNTASLVSVTIPPLEGAPILFSTAAFMKVQDTGVLSGFFAMLDSTDALTVTQGQYALTPMGG